MALALKQIELTQELTRSTMNTLVDKVPGPLCPREQIYILEARSADLVPPSEDLPATPAPAAAVQKEILDKAASYVTQTYAQLPPLTAGKTTLRFQDNVEAVAQSSGVSGGATDVVTGASFSNPATFIHYINSTSAAITLDRGAEKLPSVKDKTPWGANRMIALEEPTPALGTVFREVQDSGTLQFLRWELIGSKPAAVFGFSVPRKFSHFDVDVCCFPKVDQQGTAHFYTSFSGAAFGGSSGGGGVSGDYQTNTDWHDFKATAPYHGELFVYPESGIVVRLITMAEFKSTDVVHQLDTRVDYAPVKASLGTLILPVKTFVYTVVVPHGDSGAGAYTSRTTLFTSEFTEYGVAR